jgi:hypothetical protein
MPRLAPVASSADNDEVTPEVEAADKAGAPDEAEPEEETGGAE